MLINRTLVEGMVVNDAYLMVVDDWKSGNGNDCVT